MDCLVCSFCFRFIGSIELQIGRKLYLQQLGVSVNHTECDMEEEHNFSVGENSGACASTSSPGKKVELPRGIVESLMNGELKLPYSDKFSLPPAVPCAGDCGEAYYCR